MRSLLSNSLALAAVLSATVALGAQADVVRVITRPTVWRSTVVVPQRHVIITAPTVTRRTIMVTPGVSRTIMTMPAVITPAVTTTSTSTTTITETKVQTPDPLERLHNMMDQITLGESNGMLSADESAALRAEYDRLDSLIQADLVGGLTDTEIDDLETQLTLFNQQISRAMQ